jgi:hypothetical protein
MEMAYRERWEAEIAEMRRVLARWKTRAPVSGKGEKERAVTGPKFERVSPEWYSTGRCDSRGAVRR